MAKVPLVDGEDPWVLPGQPPPSLTHHPRWPLLRGGRSEPNLRDKKEAREGNVRSTPLLFSSLPSVPAPSLFEPQENGRPPHKWEIRPLTHQGSRLNLSGHLPSQGIILKTMPGGKERAFAKGSGSDRRVFVSWHLHPIADPSATNALQRRNPCPLRRFYCLWVALPSPRTLWRP